MFIEKIRRRESGILLYGITPPKIHTPVEKIISAAERTIRDVQDSEIDALVVYDVQDESSRTADERPFPFVNALDPFAYSSEYLQGLSVPKVIYRPAGKFTIPELGQWLNGLKKHGHYPIFVGLPSPDHVVKTSLKEAYDLWREQHSQHSVIGAITIPERHFVLKDEDVRILDKMKSGVSYFISQCIFNVEYTRKVLQDLEYACATKQEKIPTMIFTLTICGSVKTMEFMEWLGIYIPQHIKEEIKLSTDPVGCSLGIATSIAHDLILFCKQRSIPFGFNIESVATKKDEVEASLELLRRVNVLLKSNGLRAEVNKHHFIAE